jgi:hypothetical protein
VINQNMANIRTRVTLDTSPLSIFVTFGEIQAIPLELQEQVLRPLLVVDPENPENELVRGCHTLRYEREASDLPEASFPVLNLC